MARPKGSKNKEEAPKTDAPDLVLDKQPEKVDSESILKQLAEERAARLELEARWNEKEQKEKKERDPMSGTGKLCQAYKITVAEAWQLGKEVINTPDGRQDMRLKKCPEGYQVRRGTNGYYIVGTENPDPEKNEYIPNCRSKYTQEYEYKMKKPAHFKLEDEPPKAKIHLCEHHAHILLNKAECFCKFCKPQQVKE